MSHVARSGGLLFGCAEIYCRLKFAAEKNRLRDSGGESPKHGIEGPNSIELRGSEPARGTEHKSRQPCRASLMHSMKSGGEAALAGDEIRPSFEDLCGHAGGCASRLAGKGSPHIKFAGGIVACDDFDRADRLCPHLLRRVKCILCTGGA